MGNWSKRVKLSRRGVSGMSPAVASVILEWPVVSVWVVVVCDTCLAGVTPVSGVVIVDGARDLSCKDVL